MDKKEVLEQLRKIHYPGFNRDIISFGIVKNVFLEKEELRIVLSFTTEPDERREQIKTQIKSLFNAFDQIKSVRFEEVQVPLKASPVPSENLKNPLEQVKSVIAVASGKGGVGKSTVAVNLACALHLLGRKVGLLDADVHGPSVPMMMGIRNWPQISEEKKLIPHERYGVSMMSLGFLINSDDPLIWRGPMVNHAIRQLLSDTEWGVLDYLVVDLPPGTGDAQISLVQTVPVKGAVIVTTPQDVALLDAKRGVLMFQKMEVKILGIVENMSYFICPHCHGKTDIFSKGGGRHEAGRLKVPFLGEIPIDPAIREGGDNGIPIVVGHPSAEVSKSFMTIVQNVEMQISNE